MKKSVDKLQTPKAYESKKKVELSKIQGKPTNAQIYKSELYAKQYQHSKKKCEILLIFYKTISTDQIDIFTLFQLEQYKMR